MKRNEMPFGPSILILLAFTGLALAGCSYSVGSIGHNIITRVDTSQSNYRVVDSVTGEAKHDYYFFYLGGPSKQNLLDQARRDMIQKARLMGRSRAVINVTTDMKTSWFLWWFQKTAYVSGDVIEFFDVLPEETQVVSKKTQTAPVSFTTAEPIRETPVSRPPPMLVEPEPRIDAVAEASPEPPQEAEPETAPSEILKPAPVIQAMDEPSHEMNGEQKRAKTNLKIRSGPSSSSARVGLVSAGQTVFVLEEQNNWARIGQNRWVSALYLGPLKEEAPAEPAMKPDSEEAPEPAPISEPAVEAVEIEPISVQKQPAPVETGVGEWVVTARIHIRTGPASTFNELGLLQAGDRVNVIQIKGRWAKIGEDRWVSTQYLKKITE